MRKEIEGWRTRKLEEGSCCAQSQFGVENMKGHRKKKLSRKSVKHPQPQASARMTPGGNLAPGVHQAPSLTAGAYQAPSLTAGRAEGEAHAMEEDRLSREEQEETKETNDVNGNLKEEEWPHSIILPAEGEENEEHLASLGESLRSEERKDEESDNECASVVPVEAEIEDERLRSLRQPIKSNIEGPSFFPVEGETEEEHLNPIIEEQEKSEKEAHEKKKVDDGGK